MSTRYFLTENGYVPEHAVSLITERAGKTIITHHMGDTCLQSESSLFCRLIHEVREGFTTLPNSNPNLYVANFMIAADKKEVLADYYPVIGWKIGASYNTPIWQEHYGYNAQLADNSRSDNEVFMVYDAKLDFYIPLHDAENTVMGGDIIDALREIFSFGQGKPYPDLQIVDKKFIMGGGAE